MHGGFPVMFSFLFANCCDETLELKCESYYQECCGETTLFYWSYEQIILFLAGPTSRLCHVCIMHCKFPSLITTSTSLSVDNDVGIIPT